ncbi:MAG TPA: hypothetical protein VF771_20435, partial [Longimicrobiaceae bacterium]
RFELFMLGHSIGSISPHPPPGASDRPNCLIALSCAAAAMLLAACGATPTGPSAATGAPAVRRTESPQPIDCTKYAMAGGRLCEDPAATTTSDPVQPIDCTKYAMAGARLCEEPTASLTSDPVQPVDCTKYAMAGGRLCEDPAATTTADPVQPIDCTKYAMAGARLCEEPTATVSRTASTPKIRRE